MREEILENMSCRPKFTNYLQIKDTLTASTYDGAKQSKPSIAWRRKQNWTSTTWKKQLKKVPEDDHPYMDLSMIVKQLSLLLFCLTSDGWTISSFDLLVIVFPLFPKMYAYLTNTSYGFNFIFWFLFHSILTIHTNIHTHRCATNTFNKKITTLFLRPCMKKKMTSKFNKSPPFSNLIGRSSYRYLRSYQIIKGKNKYRSTINSLYKTPLSFYHQQTRDGNHHRRT